MENRNREYNDTLSRFQRNYSSKDGSNEGDPTEIGKGVFVKPVSTAIQGEGVHGIRRRDPRKLVIVTVVQGPVDQEDIEVSLK